MPKTILSSRTEHQCERLHSYLQEFKSVTTIEARRELDILMPAARIFDLKAKGINIVTVMESTETKPGHVHKVARYFLLPGGANE